MLSQPSEDRSTICRPIGERIPPACNSVGFCRGKYWRAVALLHNGPPAHFLFLQLLRWFCFRLRRRSRSLWLPECGIGFHPTIRNVAHLGVEGEQVGLSFLNAGGGQLGQSLHSLVAKLRLEFLGVAKAAVY